MPRVFRFALLITLLALLFAPAGPARAQAGVDWRERPTAKFTILHAAGAEAEAERYAGFVDVIYDDIAAAFSFQTATPLTLRLYPTSESYYLVNPAARSVPGVVAHADFRRRELVVIVERTLQQTEEEVRNNVRHELTHIVAGDLSENRLNTGFQEGVAQYMERASRELESKIVALRAARDQGRLLPWSAFDQREQIYADPTLGYPQTLSVVAFLVDREGFARLRQFLEISARSSGFRSALERAYGVSPADLEAEWRDWLPSYLDGGYRSNALEVYDPRYAGELLAQGRYLDAEADLLAGLDRAQKNPELYGPDLIATMEDLIAEARGGMRADELAEDARRALEQADYERAAELVGLARTAYATLGDSRQEAVLAEYEARVSRGLRASEQLVAAAELARALRYPQARAAADDAASEFAALGDQLRLGNAAALRQSLDSRQRLAGLVLLTVGFAGVLLSLIGRIFQRPAEVW
jgi:hypothetical protein